MDEKITKNKKSVKNPKNGKLINTTDELCRKCKYHCILGAKICVCDYFLITGKMRKCDIKKCDKFEELIGKRRKKMPN